MGARLLWLCVGLGLGGWVAEGRGQRSRAGRRGRDEFECGPNQMAQELRSVDGFLELGCAPFPGRCERREGPPRCLRQWRNRCPLRHFVSAIQRRFSGRKSKLYYKVRCCGHPSIDYPEQYVNQFTRSFGPEQVFDARGTNGGAELVRYLANIVGTSRRDHQTVVIGQLRCKRRTTTTQPTTTPRLTTPRPTTLQPTPRRRNLPSQAPKRAADNSGRPPASSGPGVMGCFPSGARLLTKHRGLVAVQDLALGEEVASESWLEGREEFSPLVGFIHREAKAEAMFVELGTEGGRELVLTPNHLLPAFRCPGESGESGLALGRVPDEHIQQAVVRASEVRLGDCVLTANGTLEAVARVRRALRSGVFAPVTEAGTVVVDGVRASCYSDLPSQYLQHGLFRSWLALRDAVGRWIPAALLPDLLGSASLHSPSPTLHLLHHLVNLCAPS